MREPKTYCVHILASRSRALYVGMTSNLPARLDEHRRGATAGHTARYRISRLVHVEITHDVHAAIARERQLKVFRREKKIRLIESANPTWADLALDMLR
ncbi:MAG: GIY-YIG nuclease family protein [Lysobacteraceae bacterium]